MHFYWTRLSPEEKRALLQETGDYVNWQVPVREPMNLTDALRLKPGDHVYYLYPVSFAVRDGRSVPSEMFSKITPVESLDELAKIKRNDVPLNPLTVQELEISTGEKRVIPYEKRELLFRHMIEVPHLIGIPDLIAVEIRTQELGIRFPYYHYSIIG